jgi:two-component system cell cycle response regulator DivK
MGIISGDCGTVLVADDSDDIRVLLGMMLRLKGVSVVEAEDGERAVELARRARPDLILMDLSMPVLDGYEATRRIRGDRETSRIPVVAVSALCDEWHNRQKALEAGCVECVSKPVDFGVLGGLLQKHLQVH